MAEKNSSIQLIIKAPSQNVDDQIIHCNLDWSIEQLKRHISEVYPNKPAVNEQKLIYSGHLLQDSSSLKDILKNDETQAILHLVCNRQHKSVNFQDVKFQPSQSMPLSSTSETPNLHTVEGTVHDISTNDLRRRAGAQPSNVPDPTVPTFWPASPTMVPYEAYAAQMAAMQQVYSTYYAQYYQNFQGMPAITGNLPVTSSIQQNAPAPVLPQQPVQRDVPPAMPDAPNRNIRLNAQGGPDLDENDEMGNRDWLDYFYMCCRGFVLFSIVYFYSSPERLLIVVGLAMLAMIYQEGFVRPRMQRQLIQRQNQARPRPAAPVPPIENANNTEDAPSNENQDTSDPGAQRENEIEPIMDGENPPHARNQNAQTEQQQNPAWTFITSFFSSLIPDQPAPVNLN